MEVDSLVWILVTEMAVRDVPLPLGRFVIPVIPQSDDEEEQEFAQLEEDDEEEQDFVTSRKRQGREVAAMQRRFQVLRSSALNADQGDIGYPMTIPRKYEEDYFSEGHDSVRMQAVPAFVKKAREEE
jgi:hypothetical protein